MAAKRRRRSIIALTVLFVLVAASAFCVMGPFHLWSKMNKGLDIQGGLHVVYQAQPAAGQQVTNDTMNTAMGVIRRRVDSLGVAEPVIQREGSDRIIVELPGIKDPEMALQTIGKTGVLQFRDEKGSVITGGTHLLSARAEVDPQTGGYVVAIKFDAEGSKAIADYTSKNIGKRMPVYLDNQLLTNPVVQSAITGGDGIITGFSSIQSAQSAAIAISSGALPVKLSIIENRTVSATLGAASLHQSTVAGIVGAALVVAFMLLIYRIPGFWADFALALYSLLLLIALYLMNATITLPGIIGIVLSIGMAVDANVIIYERIKEELRLGKTLRNAVDAGFKNGFRAIFDSNATTVLAAGILFWLGSGPIRGFAITLAVGVVLSMFTAITFTRYILHQQVDAGIKPGPFFFTAQAKGEAK